jgi:hypothetical protein
LDPHYPIEEVRSDLMTDSGRLARASYLRVHLQWWTGGGVLSRSARLDTGAPFSVLPYTLWHGRNVTWQLLGHQLLDSQGQPLPSYLDWHGISCILAEVHLRLTDEANNQSRFLRVIAKLVTRRQSPAMEDIVLLDYNFLHDNSLILNLNPRNRQNLGTIPNVVGFLTVP